jgi:hypothetical protein
MTIILETYALERCSARLSWAFVGFRRVVSRSHFLGALEPWFGGVFTLYPHT